MVIKDFWCRERQRETDTEGREGREDRDKRELVFPPYISFSPLKREREFLLLIMGDGECPPDTTHNAILTGGRCLPKKSSPNYVKESTSNVSWLGLGLFWGGLIGAVALTVIWFVGLEQSGLSAGAYWEATALVTLLVAFVMAAVIIIGLLLLLSYSLDPDEAEKTKERYTRTYGSARAKP